MALSPKPVVLSVPVKARLTRIKLQREQEKDRQVTYSEVVEELLDSFDVTERLVRDARGRPVSIPNYNPDLPHCGAHWPNLGPAGGKWTCTLDKGHDGYHEAGNPDHLKVFSSVPQDDDDITWDES